jgi:hypothetical protein
MATDCGVALIGVDHLNKSGGTQAILRMLGSIAFAAAPRSMYVVVRDNDDPDRRLLLPAKNNIAKVRTGLAFRVMEKFAPAPVFDSYPVIEWEDEPVTMTADEALAQKADGRKSESAEAAKKLIAEMLAEGPVPRKDIERRAEVMKISPKSLRTAMEVMAVRSIRDGGRHGQWLWSLPDQGEISF